LDYQEEMAEELEVDIGRGILYASLVVLINVFCLHKKWLLQECYRLFLFIPPNSIGARAIGSNADSSKGATDWLELPELSKACILGDAMTTKNAFQSVVETPDSRTHWTSRLPHGTLRRTLEHHTWAYSLLICHSSFVDSLTRSSSIVLV